MPTVAVEDMSIERLTKRQQKILKLLALGDSVNEVGLVGVSILGNSVP